MGAPYYRFFPADYDRDTKHLSLMQHGAYRLLIDLYMNLGPIGNDMERINRTLHATSREEQAAIEYVLVEFFLLEGGKWLHKRCDREIAYQEDRSAKARKSARVGRYTAQEAEPEEAFRAAEVDLAEQNKKLRADRLRAGRQLATHTKGDWFALVEACGSVCVRCGDSEHALTKDHIVPLYQGGSDGIENIQPLCWKCNSSKGPEATDFRPSGWRQLFAERSTNAERTLDERSANQNQNQNQRKESANKRGSRFDLEALPLEWEATCRSLRSDLDPNGAFERFRDYWIAQPGAKGVKANWLATWRNWVRNERSPAKPSPASQVRGYL